jgi:hypothetical protein
MAQVDQVSSTSDSLVPSDFGLTSGGKYLDRQRYRKISANDRGFTWLFLGLEG